jgi:hypothetical protein
MTAVSGRGLSIDHVGYHATNSNEKSCHAGDAYGAVVGCQGVGLAQRNTSGIRVVHNRPERAGVL